MSEKGSVRIRIGWKEAPEMNGNIRGRLNEVIRTVRKRITRKERQKE